MIRSIPGAARPPSAAPRRAWWSAPSTRRSSFSPPAWVSTAMTSAAPPSPNIRSTAWRPPSSHRRSSVQNPLLVRTRGAEVGVRSKAVQNLNSSVSLFFLDQASELVFDGDTGQTEAGRALGTLWRRVYQRLPAHFLAPFRCQSRALPRPVSRLRLRSGGPLPVPRRISPGPDRQCTR